MTQGRGNTAAGSVKVAALLSGEEVRVIMLSKCQKHHPVRSGGGRGRPVFIERPFVSERVVTMSDCALVRIAVRKAEMVIQVKEVVLAMPDNMIPSFELLESVRLASWAESAAAGWEIEMQNCLYEVKSIDAPTTVTKGEGRPDVKLVRTKGGELVACDVEEDEDDE